jgi:hypothetical protein
VIGWGRGCTGKKMQKRKEIFERKTTIILFKLFIGLLQFYGTLRYITVHYGTRLFPGREKKMDVKNT